MKSVVFVLIMASLISIYPSIGFSAPEPNRNAPVGGMIVRNLGAEPPTIHPIMAEDVPADNLNKDYLCDSLLYNAPNTWELKPRLAEKFESTKDNKVYTFHIRKDAVFHDGKPITAEDVKFSFDAVKIPEHKAANLIPYFDGIEKIEVVNEKTIKFYLKNTYFQNLTAIGTAFIIPKHVYGDISKSVKMTKDSVCSGPYTLDKYERGQRIVVKKFDKWYGLSVPEFKGEANFQSVIFRFIKEGNIEVETFKKGDLDISNWPMPMDTWVKLAVGPMFGKTVFKKEVANSGVRAYGFYGFNFKNNLFKDRNVRQALGHLQNREEMNQKFRYGKSELATGPFSKFSEYADPSVKPIEYNPKKAQELLSKAGWKDSDKDGVLDKEINGKKVPFRFTVAYASKDSEKYHTFFKEDLKKVGIDMELKLMEWNSFNKLLDEKNFDMIAMSWGGVIDWDPKQIWHSSSIDGGGSNFISYTNLQVDKLIDEARLIVDRKKRIQMLRKVYKTIAEDVPYLPWFNNKFDYYIVSDKIGQPADSFEKKIGFEFWWRKEPNLK
jgi:microcin C transport system substrate-binding protein